MAFDPAEPQDITKIRNLGTVIRPNWVAIQDGESSFLPKAINFNNRTPLGVANDPAAIADSYIVYSKDKTAGGAELWGIDESSNIVQMTQSGKLGSATTNLVINNITFGSDTFSYGLGSIVKARGSVNSAGVLLAGSLNVASISVGGTGLRTINISADVLSVGSIYQVIVSPSSSSNGNARTVTVTSKATPVAVTNVAVGISIHQANGTTLINEAFDFIVLGGI